MPGGACVPGGGVYVYAGGNTFPSQTSFAGCNKKWFSAFFVRLRSLQKARLVISEDKCL